ncbi:hypothetical protein [Microbacterium sp. XT11]|uniref:hypothetical protein n=1 Tax=Microbacterium sp. XT11 TaxID=367477 RepID=UPI0008353F55|nr:hypothetical protein [Microbacterium sp. XT11]
MAESPSINIQIDEQALRDQIDKTVQDAFREASMRLRLAADALDGGEWIRGFEEHQEQRLRDEYERGRKHALAEQEGQVDR